MMKSTTNYGLMLYDGTDAPDLVAGYNKSMNTLDSTIKSVSDTIPADAAKTYTSETFEGLFNILPEGVYLFIAKGTNTSNYGAGYMYKFSTSMRLWWTSNLSYSGVNRSLTGTINYSTSAGALTVDLVNTELRAPSTVLVSNVTAAPTIKSITAFGA